MTQASKRFRRRPSAKLVESTESSVGITTAQIISKHAGRALKGGRSEDVDALYQQLAGVDTKTRALNLLGSMLSPANHPTPAGLAATRLYAELFH